MLINSLCLIYDVIFSEYKLFKLNQNKTNNPKA